MESHNQNKHLNKIGYIPPKIICTASKKYELALNNGNRIETISLPLNLMRNDSVMNSIELLNSVTINNIQSIIELFKELRHYQLKFVFDWVYIMSEYEYICVEGEYQLCKRTKLKHNLSSMIEGGRHNDQVFNINPKDNKRISYYDQFVNILSSKNVPGIRDFVKQIQENQDDMLKVNGYIYTFTSEFRSLILSILIKLRKINEHIEGGEGQYKLDIISVISKVSQTNKNNDYYPRVNQSLAQLKESLIISLFIFHREDIDYFISKLKVHPESSNELVTLCVILSKFLNYSKPEDNPYQDLIKINIERIKNDHLLRFMYLFIVDDQIPIEEIHRFLSNTDISLSIKLIFLISKCSVDVLLKSLDVLYSALGVTSEIDGLIINGTSDESNSIIANFVNKHDSLLVGYFLSRFYSPSDSRLTYKLGYEFNETLNKLELFNLRIALNLKLDEISNLRQDREKFYLEGNDQTPFSNKQQNINSSALTYSKDKMRDKSYTKTDTVEFFLTCIFCGNKVQTPDTSRGQNFNSNINTKKTKEIINYCNNPKCIKPLPVCCICLQPIEVENDLSSNVKSSKPGVNEKQSLDEIPESREANKIHIIWCLKCRHGGHFKHIQDWFLDLTICPNPVCDCICLEGNLMIL